MLSVSTLEEQQVILINKKLDILDGKDPYDMLDDGECVSEDISIDGEDVKVEFCRDGEDISIESIEPIDMEGKIKKFNK